MQFLFIKSVLKVMKSVLKYIESVLKYIAYLYPLLSYYHYPNVNEALCQWRYYKSRL